MTDKHPLTAYVEKHKVTRRAYTGNLRTPGENDFCSCGGIFSVKLGTCNYCGARKSLGNRFSPGHRDWGQPEINAALEEAEEQAEKEGEQ